MIAWSYSDAKLCGLLPELAQDANKYTRGKVSLVAGCSRYPGAAALAAREGYLSGLAAEFDVREYQKAVRRVGVVARVLNDAAAARRVLHRYREDAPARRGYLDGLRADAVEQLHRRGLRSSRRARTRRYSFAEIFIVCHRAERSLSPRRPSSRPCVPSPRCTARRCARAAPSTRRR